MNKLSKSEKQLLLSQLTKETFWSSSPNKLDVQKNKKCIIENIISSGSENDEMIMWKLYSYHDIKNIALNIEYITYERLRYIAFVLKIKERKFKCFSKKPWNLSY